MQLNVEITHFAKIEETKLFVHAKMTIIPWKKIDQSTEQLDVVSGTLIFYSYRILIFFILLGRIRYIQTGCDNVQTQCGTDSSVPIEVATVTQLQYLNDNGND